MRQAARPDEAPTHNRRSDLQESNVVALGHDVVLFMDDNLLHISLLQRLFHWLVSSIFNFLGSKNQSPVIDFSVGTKVSPSFSFTDWLDQSLWRE